MSYKIQNGRELLELAAKAMGMSVLSAGPWERESPVEPHDSDPNAATRRAIVRAAAEMATQSTTT